MLMKHCLQLWPLHKILIHCYHQVPSICLVRKENFLDNKILIKYPATQMQSIELIWLSKNQVASQRVLERIVIQVEATKLVNRSSPHHKSQQIRKQIRMVILRTLRISLFPKNHMRTVFLLPSNEKEKAWLGKMILVKWEFTRHRWICNQYHLWVRWTNLGIKMMKEVNLKVMLGL